MEKELSLIVDQSWQRELLGNLFGDEEVFKIGHTDNDEIYNLEVVLKRGERIV